MRPSKDTVHTIAEALQGSALFMIRELVDRELSLTASDVLFRLHEEGPTRLTALAKAAGVSQPSMTQFVQRFERRGIVSRSTDPNDKRAWLVAITPAGREIVRQRQEGIRKRLAELLSRMDPEDVASLQLASRVSAPIIVRLSDQTTNLDHPTA